MMSHPIKTAVIGYGYSAKTFHIPFLESLAEFEFCAISSRQHEAIAAQFPRVTCYDSAEKLIEQSDAELVIITAPNDVHFSLAKMALEHGKHVVVEKPFVTRAQDGETLIRIAQEQQLTLSVYHNRRWDHDFLTVKKLIADGKLGEVKWFESHFDRYRPEARERWRESADVEGSGILYDLAPHLIDQALELFGMPEAITAQCRSMRQVDGATDFFNVLLDYSDFLVQLHANPYSPGENLRYKILGTQAKYIKMGLDPQEERLKAGITALRPAETVIIAEGSLYTEEYLELIPTVQGGYEHYFVQLADSIRQGTPPPVTAEDALNAIRLIELAMESSNSGQTIKVNL
ncbi:oxidoreductase [Vibrio rhizosphaerae]|uniref:Oxidoreductase n=1 Tax=Vibrio rhizosphaerae TaxID=398736 RepID=A0ABU4IY62_9VIBR|nr:oxidoreductase [Vibrio rhizosphaerae]MDW6094342.1 oxidoreductase [Vibrio rhizosphaerae]